MAYPQTEEEREQIKRNFEKHQAGCTNTDCVCRKAVTKTIDGCCENEGVYGTRGCNHSCHFAAPQDTQWEESFKTLEYELLLKAPSSRHSERVNFISNLLTSQRERLATAVEGTGKAVEVSNGLSVDYHKGYADGNADAAAFIRHSPLQ